MYRFTLGDTDVQCETAEELRAVLVNSAPTRTKRVVKRKYKPRKVAAKKPAKKRAPRKSITPEENGYSIADLPYVKPVKGGLSWAVVKRVAKKIKGLKDQRQLRSDLLKRQEMGE